MVGPTPPLIGGVSVFLYRRKRQLEIEGHQVEVLDHKKVSLLGFFLRLALTPFKKYDLVSLNHHHWSTALVLLVLGMASRTEFIDHNWRILEEIPSFLKPLFKTFLWRSKKAVLISPHLRQRYEDHGVALPPHVELRNIFIPPPLDDERKILKTYTDEALEFLGKKHPLVVANACKITLYHDTDLYGLDMCIELVRELKKTHPNVGMLFALGEIGDGDYFKAATQKITMAGLANNFHFMTGQKELWPLFKQADLMVRPTITDGYSFSIAEALYFGCPTVASDVCPRPVQTVTFTNRDGVDFARKCQQVLAARTAQAA